jgi:hypothetical protein
MRVYCLEFTDDEVAKLVHSLEFCATDPSWAADEREVYALIKDIKRQVKEQTRGVIDPKDGGR